MAGWHHWLDGRESGWTPVVGDGQGGLACCDSWGLKKSDTTERLNWTELNWNLRLHYLHLRKKNFFSVFHFWFAAWTVGLVALWSSYLVCIEWTGCSSRILSQIYFRSISSVICLSSLSESKDNSVYWNTSSPVGLNPPEGSRVSCPASPSFSLFQGSLLPSVDCWQYLCFSEE